MTEPKPIFNPYPLADYLVGPFSYDAEEVADSPETLQPWQIPYYDVAVSALYNAAKETVGTEPEDIPAAWMPAPEEGAELYRGLAYERKLHRMISSVQSYIGDYKSGAISTRMRVPQREIMDALAIGLTESGIDEDITIKSPPGTGKTMTMITLIQALKYKEEPSDPVNALLLVPSKNLVNQTAAEFAQFAPEIDLGIYFSEKKKLKDVTVMTYRSFDIAVRKGILTRDMYNVMLLDEEDTAGGENTAESIEEYRIDPETGERKPVFAFSATTRANKELAYKSHLVREIDRGVLSPLSVRSIETGASIEEEKRFLKRADYAPEELAKLIENNPRNQIIIDEILSGLKDGLRVITRCLPGGDLIHPRLLAAYLNDVNDEHGMIVPIKNPYTGQVTTRKINARIIDGGMPMKQREAIYSKLENPRERGFDTVDVLLFVDTLTRGWSSRPTKKVINACPSRSYGVVEQLMGRITRPFEREDGTLVFGQAVDLVDQYSMNAPIRFSDIINRDAPAGQRYVEGAIIGPGLVDLRLNNETQAFEPIPVRDLEEEVHVEIPRKKPQSPKKRAVAPVAPLEIKQRTVEDTLSDNPFDDAKEITSENLDGYVSLEEIAAELGTDSDVVEEAVLERNMPLGVLDETYYLPVTHQRRLTVYIKRNM